MASAMTRVVAMLGLVGAAVVGVPTIAPGADTTLYVLTEDMKLVPNHQKQNPVNRRSATSALRGTANKGTPLCPNSPPFESPCAVNAVGGDDVSLATGLGTLSGEFATVIQGDNPVDAPEKVVLRGTFNGHMDFSPAIVHEIPYGTFVGKVQPSGGPNTNFTGIFRLPFAGNIEVEVEGVRMTLRELLCPASPKANPYAQLYVRLYPDLYGSFREVGGIDLAYLDNVESGTCLNIQPNELSLGVPLVRFDIEF